MRKQRENVKKYKTNPFKLEIKPIKIYTYLFKGLSGIKIGKAKNVKTRFLQGKTFDPNLEILKIYDGDYEGILHRHFSNKKLKLEWFDLSNDDLNKVDQIIKNKSPRISFKEDFIGISKYALKQAMLTLTHSEFKVLFYILLKLTPGKDEVTLDLEEVRIKLGLANTTGIYDSLRGLEEKEFIAKSWKGFTTYWINMNYFFNGDRKKNTNNLTKD
jgi:hypothetical protein